jgi:hypothetical protein
MLKDHSTELRDELLSKHQRDRTAEAWARGMVQQFGYVTALDSAKRHRDQNAEATYSFSHWNRIVKALVRFATID